MSAATATLHPIQPMRASARSNARSASHALSECSLDSAPIAAVSSLLARGVRPAGSRSFQPPQSVFSSRAAAARCSRTTPTCQSFPLHLLAHFAGKRTNVRWRLRARMHRLAGARRFRSVRSYWRPCQLAPRASSAFVSGASRTTKGSSSSQAMRRRLLYSFTEPVSPDT